MEDKLIEKVIACATKVHQELGAGFVERIYHCGLKVALDDAKLDFDSEKDFSVFYQDQRVGSFKADFFVESKVVVLVKAQSEKLTADVMLQSQSYFKASKAKAAVLLNFGMKDLEIQKIV